MSSTSWQFSIFSLAPAACIGDYTFQLVFLAALPLMVMVGVLLLGIGCKAFMQCTQGRRAKTDVTLSRSPSSMTDATFGRSPSSMDTIKKKSFFSKWVKPGLAAGTPVAIIIAFCVLPTVASGLFATFDCETFVADDASGASQSFLSTNLAMRCSSGDFKNPVYDEARATATALIFVWPFGMPFLTILALLASRRALLAKRATFWTRALGFLHREYRADCYWWEIVEMGRRLAITSFVLLVLPAERETMRLVFAQVRPAHVMPAFISHAHGHATHNARVPVSARRW